MQFSPEVDALTELGGLSGATRTDPDIVADYSRDSTDLLEAGAPAAVVSPATAEEVSDILAWASRNRIGVVTRGAATGISGGALAGDGVVVLSTEKLTAIREVSATDRLAVGGTISGEHGIGRLKRRWLTDEVGEVGVDLMRRIKAAVDPLGIMNPGSLLP